MSQNKQETGDGSGKQKLCWLPTVPTELVESKSKRHKQGIEDKERKPGDSGVLARW